MDGQGRPGMGMAPGSHEMMIQMWESLGDDQKRILMKRMLELKIIRKEGRVKEFEHKIDTMKILRKMLEEC